MAKKLNTYLKKGLKVLLWIVGSIVVLFLLIVVLIQVPAIQNFAKNKAVTYLEDKIKTKVSIGRIEIGLPKKVILEGFYFEDQKKDTLLAGQKLSIDISLFKLLSNEVEINSIDLKGITANVTRNKDSVFNFDYIIKAFASKEPKEKDSEPMKISVNNINLDNIRLKYNDAISKNDVKVRLNHFDTKFNNFDLDAMDFDIPKINLDGLKLTLDQGLVEGIAKTSVKVADTVSKRPDFKLKLGEISLTKIDIGYDNVGNNLNTGVTLDKLLLAFNDIDLNKQMIDIKSFELANVKGGLALHKADKNIHAPNLDSTAIRQTGWKVKLNAANISNVNFKFDDENATRTKKGIDYKHLNINNFNLKGDSFYYTTDAISGNIAMFTVKDKSGLDIQSFRSDFFYGSKGAYLKNLYLKTPQTLLKDEINVKYASLESIKKNLGDLALDANLENSAIGFKDILTFVPTLENTNPFKSNPNAVLLINGKISGKVSDIHFPNFEISGIGSTSISARGRITGLPDVKKAYFDVTINNFRSTAKDINTFVPAGTIPKNISIPPVFALAGTFKGAIDNFNTNMNLVSSYGNANVKALFDQRVKKGERYNADVALNDFDLGRLLKNDSIGKITLTAKVNGKGLDPKTANATLRGLLQKAQFNGYTYRNLKINGDILAGKFNVDAGMKDPNLTFDLVANGGFNNKYPSAKLNLNVDIADLDKLNLHAGPMKLKGNVVADIPTADPDFLNGEISLNHLQILKDKDLILLDSINVVAVSTPEMNSIKVKSQILKANIEGKYKLTQLATALQNSVAKYFDTNPKGKKQKTDPQHLDFDIVVDNDPVIFKIFPQITGLEPIKITGRYNSVNDTIVLKGSIPRLVYGANTISGANISIDTKDNALVYNVDIDAIQNESYMLPFTSLSGNVKDDVVTYNLKIRDKGKKDQYAIAGTMKTANGDTEIRLNPEGLKLNYEDWVVSPDNLIRFGKDGIYANNFELSNKGNILKIRSQSDAPNAPLSIDFTNFNLETLTNMVKKDKLLIGGTLNGNALVKNIMTNPVFTSDLTIVDFSFKGEKVGDIAIKVNNNVADTYAANITITGEGNQVNLTGNYKASTSSFDMNLDMQHLEVKSIQGFTAGNITEGKGFFSGNFKITGTAAQPKVLGELEFNDVAFRVKQLNSYFKNINEKIVVNNQGILFDRFTVSDEKNNELVVNGAVLTTDFKDYKFNLTVDADNFRAVNSKAKDNDLYYGDLFLDTHLIVKGSLESPVVRGNVKINEDTKLTIVLPQSDPGIADREGIVEFVDEDNVQLQETAIMKNEMDNSEVKGMDVSVNIQTDKKALLSLIIDKGNGDYLNLKGEADLTGGIDPSGKTTLTGKYEFTEGAYEMTFNLIKRKFDIKEGSYIIWNGEPTSANLSITAIYKIDAAPIDLVDDQLGSVSPTVRNTYKQKLPFQTLLKMNGELLKPIITFDIVLPEANYNVSSDIVTASQTKLAQLREEPDELNKQVFALLLLGHFIGENPFASEAGSGGAEGLARQSVSKILSQQLNSLAGDLIKGVELNFDLESTEDYTSGVKENRTDLNVGISKRLLNDRLKVTVGSSFGLEGQQQQNEETNNIAGDLSADYQLTKDGRYLVRAYRKNEYQVALQGQVIETGVAFVITMDYNKFNELFHRTQEEKDMKKKMQERKKAEEEAKEKAKKDAALKPVQDEK
ncbi:MAG TPA: translocation/assembly module TamB domain-containing protein [Flavobacterium sp.]|nr:translocation/assembly module TamB domain-containing protein [Flavobacterium sp.]